MRGRKKTRQFPIPFEVPALDPDFDDAERHENVALETRDAAANAAFDERERGNEARPKTSGLVSVSPRAVLHAIWLRLAALLLTWTRQPVREAVANRPESATTTGGSETLADKIAFRERLTEILLTIPSAGIAVLTYYGVSVPLTETGSTVVQKGQAVGFSLTIGVFAWLAWFYLFGLSYRLTGRRLSNALCAGVVMVTAVAIIDAPFNMLALAGGPAAQMSLIDMTHAYELRRDAVIARVTAARRLIPAIRVQAAHFASLKVQEEKSGTFSGRATPGKVSASFGQVADMLGGLADELDAGLAKTTALQDDLTAAFARRKAFTYRLGPIRDRMEGASATGDQLDALLTQAAQYDFSTSIEATLSSLDTSLLRPQPGGNAFAQTQAVQIDAIAAMARPVAGVLRAGLGDLQGNGQIVAAARRPESPLTAIRTYWRPLLPHWCAALFIDLAPLALLVILIAAYREAERGEAEAPAVTPKS